MHIYTHCKLTLHLHSQLKWTKVHHIQEQDTLTPHLVNFQLVDSCIVENDVSNQFCCKKWTWPQAETLYPKSHPCTTKLTGMHQEVEHRAPTPKGLVLRLFLLCDAPFLIYRLRKIILNNVKSHSEILGPNHYSTTGPISMKLVGAVFQ